jgi:hypothetical protein
MTQQYPPQQPPGGGYGPPPQQPPYGQQPPQQQPHGQQQPPRPPQQPPYGQPAGGPPGTPPGGMPPQTPGGGMPAQTPGGGMPPQTPGGGMPATPSYPPTPQKSKTKMIVIGVVVVVAIAVIGFFAWQNGKKAPASANPGDCIKVNSQSKDDADVEKIDCTSPEAVYKVGNKLDSASADCPTDSYIQYMQSGGKGDDFSLCLMLNTKEGECFADLTTQDPDKRTTKVACTAANAEGKVTKVVNGQAAESACPEGTGLALIYPEPKPGQTVCLVPAGGQGA